MIVVANERGEKNTDDANARDKYVWKIYTTYHYTSHAWNKLHHFKMLSLPTLKRNTELFI